MAIISRLPGGGSSKHKATGGTLKGATSYSLSWDFIPNYVCLFITSYLNELKTPCVVYKRNTDGTWNYIGMRTIHNYYDGSGGSDLGELYNVTDSGASVIALNTTDTFVWEAWQ